MRFHIKAFVSMRSRGGRWLGAIMLVGTLTAVLTAGSSLAASPTGAVTETINVGVRSLTVSPNAVSMCSSASPLTFPNGSCSSPPITITEGPAGGHVEVNGANAAPSDQAGNAWSLCWPAGAPPASISSCSAQPQLQPAQDQYDEYTAQLDATGKILAVGPWLTNAPACDGAFDGAAGGCAATPGQAANEVVGLTGPSASTDQSPTFTTSVTWTAAP